MDEISPSSARDLEYPDGLIVNDAMPMGGQNFVAGKTKWGSEIRGTLSRQPYCISVILHRAYPLPPGSGNNVHGEGMLANYCDADGDGIFETRPGPTFGIPSWVK